MILFKDNVEPVHGVNRSEDRVFQGKLGTAIISVTQVFVAVWLFITLYLTDERAYIQNTQSQSF